MMPYCWYTLLLDCGSRYRINMFFRHISPQTAFCSVQCERLPLGEDLVSEERVCLRFSAVNVFLSSVYRLWYDALATSSPPTSHTQSHGMMQMHRWLHSLDSSNFQTGHVWTLAMCQWPVTSLPVLSAFSKWTHLDGTHFLKNRNLRETCVLISRVRCLISQISIYVSAKEIGLHGSHVIIVPIESRDHIQQSEIRKCTCFTVFVVMTRIETC